MGWIVSVLGATVGRIFGSSGNLTNTDVRDAMQAIYDVLTALGKFLGQLFGNELDAWKQANPDIKDGAYGLGEIAYAEEGAWQKLLETILPNSIKWLDGRTHQWVDQWIHGVYDFFVKQMNIQWKGQYKWDIAIVDWRSFFVDPHLRDWISFHHWFNTYPTVVIQVWWAWFRHPSGFADWATPSLAKPLVDFITNTRHRSLRDELTQSVIDTSPDMPTHVEAAAVAILNSQGW